MRSLSLSLALALALGACSSSSGLDGGTGEEDAIGNPFATQNPDATTPADTPTTPDTTTAPDTTGPQGCAPYCVDQQTYVCNEDGVIVVGPPCGAGTHCVDGACLPGDPTVACDEEGKACNDGDLCTKNDLCTGGVCAGQPITCEDEPSAPCETSTCVEGVCQTTIDDGFCFIDGACWTEGQPNEVEPCQRCVPVVSTTEWSNNDGESCGAGDADPCAPELCQAGACVPQPLLCEGDTGNPCTEQACDAGVCVEQQVTGACDDGDPCTTGDVCDKGVCIGGASDCDDGLSCTADSCVGGGCSHVVGDGFCAIDGMCLASGEANPTNPCQVCDPTQANDAWTAQDGVPCDDGSSCTDDDTCVQGVCQGGDSMCPDDGDPCTVPTCDNNTCDVIPAADGTPCEDGNLCTSGEACSGGQCVGGVMAEEICGDALDNDCDGATDEDCEAPPTGCTYHADCYPEQVCADWYATGERKCSDPCGGDSDCGVGFVCTKVPGSINAGYCEPMMGPGAQGAACVDGGQCATGLCIDSVCAGGCLDDQHCTAPNHTCQMIGDFTIGFAGSACTPDGSLKQTGQSCTNDNVNWDSLQCASGHCDLTAPLNLPAVCSNVCTSQADCTVGQVCGIVIHAAPPYGSVTNPGAIPYHPQYTLPTYDGIAGCYTSPFGTGFGADGSTCTANNQCQTGHCLPLIPGDDTRFCTRMCSLDSECPAAGMQCKLDVVNLVSGWLEAQTTQNENTFSLVRICKFE